MALCLTARQQEVFDYYQRFRKSYGVFPNTSDVARHFSVGINNINVIIGALFLKGAFTDGVPLTANYRAIHAQSTNPAGMTLGKGKPAPKIPVPTGGRFSQQGLANLRAGAAKARAKKAAKVASMVQYPPVGRKAFSDMTAAEFLDFVRAATMTPTLQE